MMSGFAARNGFEVTVKGASGATLDAAGMGLDPAKPIVGTVTTDRELVLVLEGVGTRTIPAGTTEVRF